MAKARQAALVSACADLAEYFRKDYPGCLVAHDHFLTVAKEVSSSLRVATKKVGISKVVGGGVGIAGGAALLGGMALAPVTFGTSLALTVGGAAAGTLGSLTAGGSDLVLKKIASEKRGKVMQAQETLQQEMAKLSAVITKLSTACGQLTKEDWVSFHAIADPASFAYMFYSTGMMVQNVAASYEVYLIVESLTTFWGASEAVFVGALGIAEGAAAPGLSLPFLGTLVTAGSVGAKVLAGTTAAVGVGFGLWSVIDGASNIRSCETADKIDKIATDVEEQRKNIESLREQLTAPRQ